jgi:hypothetical protein
MQDSERMLDRAFGETGLFRQITVTEPYAFSTLTNRTPPQIQIDNESGSAVVMTDEVAQQDINYILVNSEARHSSYNLKNYSNIQAPLQ